MHYRSNKPKRNHFSKKKKSHNNQRRSGFKKSTLDPSLFINKGVLPESEEYISKRIYDQMPIDNRLKSTLKIKGFEKPTEIQDKTLESILDNRDLLGIAQTGTGKTGAFLIPIINQLLNEKRNPFALIVVPTRELALQVQDEFKSMTKRMGLYSYCFIGGTNINKDLQLLRRSSHIVIGTPGRILDLVNRKALDLRNFNTLILDEFDRMLDMGFVHDVKNDSPTTGTWIAAPIMRCVTGSKRIFAHVVPRKGRDNYAAARIAQDIRILGYKRLYVKTDQEPAILALKEMVKTELDVEGGIEESPVGESQSSGGVENAIQQVQGQVRTMRKKAERPRTSP